MDLKSVKKLFMIVAVSGLTIFTLHAVSPIPDNKPVEEVALLSKHETKAIFREITYRKCFGRTAQCPNECGHSGEFAKFEIQSYTNYEKPGLYGDPEQKEFFIQLTDAHKNDLKVSTDGKPLAATLKTIRELKPNDVVTLNWNHNYVTAKYPDGTSTKSPRRDVVKIEKLKK